MAADMTIPELIARCEAASGPSYALDTDIYKAMRPGEYQRRLDALLIGPMKGRLGPADYDGYITPPAYSASLDAALSLLPEGWRPAFTLHDSDVLPGRRWSGCLWPPSPDVSEWPIISVATSFPLALLAAILKAMAIKETV